MPDNASQVGLLRCLQWQIYACVKESSQKVNQIGWEKSGDQPEAGIAQNVT